MERAVLAGSPPIEIMVRRRARSRRFTLRVARDGGAVTLTIPAAARLKDGLEFVRAQEGWIRDAMARHPAVRPVEAGVRIPFEGQDVLIGQDAAIRAPVLSDGHLWLPARRGAVGAQVAGFLKVAARERLAGACDRYAAMVGRLHAGITLRDTRSRWGSCTAAGRLMFSWRLVMAPTEVLHYVAAHEVAHLVEMNHSPAFWAEVARIFPEFEAQRQWLRQNGAALQAIDFRAQDKD